MKNFSKRFFLVSVFLLNLCLYSQSKTLKTWFKDGKYDRVIERLTLKEKSTSLSYDEYFLLSKALSKSDKQFESLVIINKLIPEFLEQNDFQNIAVAYNLKAENLVDLSKIEEGVLFCNRTIDYLEKNNAPYLEELCLKCGILYDRNGEHLKAFNTYQRITQKYIRETPVFINNYGTILLNTKQYNNALTYLKRGITISYEANELGYVNVSLTNIAKILLVNEQWQKAKIYLDSAQTMLAKSSSVRHKKEWLKTYYHYFLSQKKYQEANKVILTIDDYNKLIYDHTIQNRRKELSAIDTRKNILSKKVSFINTKIQKSNENKLITYILIICIAIAILSWVLFSMYKSTKLKYEKIVNEQELLASQMTPHFIFNALSILQGMVLNNEHQKGAVYVTKFSNILKFLIKDSSQDFIPIHEEVSGLKDYVELQNLGTRKNIKLEVNIEETLLNKLLIPTMILQPFIENAIIHGFKNTIENPKITISFSLNGKELKCSIQDNGVGYSTAPKTVKHKSSLATNIVKDRFAILSKKMHRNYDVSIQNLQSIGQQGTEVLLQLPYTIKNKL